MLLFLPNAIFSMKRRKHNSSFSKVAWKTDLRVLVILGNMLSFSGPQFPHLLNEGI